MNIHVATATATATTGLAAFDKALNGIGIANYNLIELSSVIPPGSEIIRHEDTIPGKYLPGQWGDKLYVVEAESRVITPNVEAWAGIGWVQDYSTGEGLFVEHEGFSEGSIRGDIQDSLTSMMEYRKDHDFGPIEMEVCGITCESHPVTALVVAAYQSVDWEMNPTKLQA